MKNKSQPKWKIQPDDIAIRYQIESEGPGAPSSSSARTWNEPVLRPSAQNRALAAANARALAAANVRALALDTARRHVVAGSAPRACTGFG